MARNDNLGQPGSQLGSRPDSHGVGLAERSSRRPLVIREGRLDTLLCIMGPV